MDNSRRIDNFNKHLDYILQGGSWDIRKLCPEDKRVLALAKGMTNLDLSRESKIQEKLRQRLEEKARNQLPNKRKLSLNLLFRPRSFFWIGLVVLVQVVVGLILGDMVAQLVFTPQPKVDTFITPPVSSILTQRPILEEFGWDTLKHRTSRYQSTQLHASPIPTPKAPLSSELLLQITDLPVIAIGNN